MGTFETIQEILKREFEVEATKETVISEHLDSLDFVEFILELDDEFLTDIEDDDIELCKTVQDVVELVDRIKFTM